MHYITRSLEKVVEQVTTEYPVVLVTGPRQVGKTTMLRKLMEHTDRGYVSLDDLHERSLAKSDPELFLQLHKPPVLIDEVQYAPELFTYIKIYADNHHEPGAFWLIGSQAFKLMQGVQESLAGRVAVLSMTALAQGEIYGGSVEPFEVNIESLSERVRQRKSVDVRELAEAIDSLKFLRYITAVAARSGQMLNISDIERDADINQVQVKAWLGVLETLGIIFYLYPYSKNLLKRLVKAPKLYFYDTGLICYLTRWNRTVCCIQWRLRKHRISGQR